MASVSLRYIYTKGIFACGTLPRPMCKPPNYSPWPTRSLVEIPVSPLIPPSLWAIEPHWSEADDATTRCTLRLICGSVEIQPECRGQFRQPHCWTLVVYVAAVVLCDNCAGGPEPSGCMQSLYALIHPIHRPVIFLSPSWPRKTNAVLVSRYAMPMSNP